MARNAKSSATASVKSRRPESSLLTQPNSWAAQDLRQIQRIEWVRLQKGGTSPIGALLSGGKLLLQCIDRRPVKMVQNVKSDDGDHMVWNPRIANGIRSDITGVANRGGEFCPQRVIGFGGDDTKAE